jgi:hypothetical protein
MTYKAILFSIQAILLKSLKSDASELKQWFLECNMTKLTESNLEQLNKNLPDDKVIQQYGNLTCSLNELDTAEQFICELAKVKGLRKRIQCLLFKYKFYEQIEQIKTVCVLCPPLKIK